MRTASLCACLVAAGSVSCNPARPQADQGLARGADRGRFDGRSPGERPGETGAPRDAPVDMACGSPAGPANLDLEYCGSGLCFTTQPTPPGF